MANTLKIYNAEGKLVWEESLIDPQVNEGQNEVQASYQSSGRIQGLIYKIDENASNKSFSTEVVDASLKTDPVAKRSFSSFA